MNADNVEAFLYGASKEGGDAPASAAAGADGVVAMRKPRFKYIVEGANLFFTSELTATVLTGMRACMLPALAR